MTFTSVSGLPKYILAKSGPTNSGWSNANITVTKSHEISKVILAKLYKIGYYVYVSTITDAKAL